MDDPRLSPLLQHLGTDEYAPPPPSGRVREAIARATDGSRAAAHAGGLDLQRYASSRLATAVSLRAIDAAAGGDYGHQYYDVPPEAERERDAADEALGGDEFVFDVQTHYVGSGRAHGTAPRVPG